MKTHVKRVVLAEQKRVEKISAIIRLGVFLVMLVSFLALEDNFPWTTLPIILLCCYALVGLVGLGLALADVYRPWFAFVYSTLDIVILFGFFGALAELYHLPLREILRLPGASLIFLFIALAAFRYQVALIVYTISLFVVLWLIFVIIFGNGGSLTSPAFYAALPLEAEYLRLAIIIFVTLMTCILVYRMRELLLNSIVENRRNKNLSKYLPTSLVDDMAHEGSKLVNESRCQMAAVLFVDIRGFTKMSENRSPKEVINFLTEFRHRMNGAIVTNGGTIDKFIGDAIMVIFGVPTPDKNDACNALKCGVAMMKNLNAWNKERHQQAKEPVGIGIGIHYGEVIAGALGDEARVEYTVIGDTVNVAERLEGLTRGLPTSLIISKSLYDQAKPFSENLDTTPLVDIKLKGRTSPIDLFAISV